MPHAVTITGAATLVIAVRTTTTGCGASRVCELHVGNAARAHEHFDRSLAVLTAQRDRVQRGIAGADLAIARLQADGFRVATSLLHELCSNHRKCPAAELPPSASSKPAANWRRGATRRSSPNSTTTSSTRP